VRDPDRKFRFICVTLLRDMDRSYPKPDRSNIEPNFSKTEDNDALDLSWQEGLLNDGRPFRGELWCQDQISMVTFFFSTIGLENASKEDMESLLTSENLIQFKPGRRDVRAVKVVDAGGNEMWSVNVLVGDDDGTYVEGGRPLMAYPRS
jgi:hypothetical protein